MILTLNGEQYRIRQLDQRNIIIERKKKPKDESQDTDNWKVEGYYGNFDDLAHALLKLVVNLPVEAKDLSELIELLRLETKKAEASIMQAVKSYHTALVRLKSKT